MSARVAGANLGAIDGDEGERLACRRTGYRGRTGLIELLVVSDAMRALIAKGADLNQLRNQAARDGLRSLRVSGAEKAALGLTTIDEVLAAAPPFAD